MEHGIYTAPERVVRDGRLACFAGERMTMAEAARRGLLEPQCGDAARAGGEPSPAERPAPDGRMDELMAMTRDELVELAAELRAPHDKGANKAVIAEAIAAAELAGGE